MNVVRRAGSRATGALALAAALALGGVSPAAAVDDFEISLPAGVGCDFPLHISGTGGNQTVKSDVNGRTVIGGTGSALVLTNESTGETFAVRSKGAPRMTITHEDGTQTVTSVGHHVLVLFPADTPAGPSTTHIAGRLVYDVDLAGNFIVRSITGSTTDICAALS